MQAEHSFDAGGLGEGSQTQEPPDGDHEGPSFTEMDPTGRYGRCDEVLGRGAFKVVYKAFDTHEGTEVAWNQVRGLSFVNGGDSKEERDRLFAEIRVLKALKHKNIMSFYDSWYGQSAGGVGTVNFITELFTSGTLRQYRRKHRQIAPEVLKGWAWQTLCGLVYLHGHNPPIIHRDLKCDNVFINGSDGTVKIGDLGLATMLRSRTAPQSVLGTPEFMAPELYEEEYDDRVDVYSFGMCLLELATMEYPYAECKNAAQIYRKVSLGIRPSGLQRVADPGLLALINLCIAPKEQRPRARALLKHPYFDSIRHGGRGPPAVEEAAVALPASRSEGGAGHSRETLGDEAGEGAEAAAAASGAEKRPWTAPAKAGEGTDPSAGAGSSSPAASTSAAAAALRRAPPSPAVRSLTQAVSAAAAAAGAGAAPAQAAPGRPSGPGPALSPQSADSVLGGGGAGSEATASDAASLASLPSNASELGVGLLGEIREGEEEEGPAAPAPAPAEPLASPAAAGEASAGPASAFADQALAPAPPAPERRFAVVGKYQEDVDVFNLRLRILEEDGSSRTVEFAFDLSRDTALSIASEMVEDLSLSPADAEAIADAIRSEIAHLSSQLEERVSMSLELAGVALQAGILSSAAELSDVGAGAYALAHRHSGLGLSGSLHVLGRGDSQASLSGLPAAAALAARAAAAEMASENSGGLGRLPGAPLLPAGGAPPEPASPGAAAACPASSRAGGAPPPSRRAPYYMSSVSASPAGGPWQADRRIAQGRLKRSTSPTLLAALGSGLAGTGRTDLAPEPAGSAASSLGPSASAWGSAGASADAWGPAAPPPASSAASSAVGLVLDAPVRTALVGPEPGSACRPQALGSGPFVAAAAPYPSAAAPEHPPPSAAASLGRPPTPRAAAAAPLAALGSPGSSLADREQRSPRRPPPGPPPARASSPRSERASSPPSALSPAASLSPLAERCASLARLFEHADGGALASGGSLASGGALASGGSLLSGGAPPLSGTLASGGALAAGGALLSGGAPPLSGTLASGGALAAGGALLSGGAPPLSGTLPSGHGPGHALAFGQASPAPALQGALPPPGVLRRTVSETEDRARALAGLRAPGLAPLPNGAPPLARRSALAASGLEREESGAEAAGAQQPLLPLSPRLVGSPAPHRPEGSSLSASAAHAHAAPSALGSPLHKLGSPHPASRLPPSRGGSRDASPARPGREASAEALAPRREGSEGGGRRDDSPSPARPAASRPPPPSRDKEALRRQAVDAMKAVELRALELLEGGPGLGKLCRGTPMSASRGSSLASMASLTGQPGGPGAPDPGGGASGAAAAAPAPAQAVAPPQAFIGG